MTLRLPLLFGASLAVAALSQSGTAEAGHAHFSGGVHISGGGHFGGGIHVGGGYHATFRAGGGWHGGGYVHPSYWGVRGRVHVGWGGYRPYYYRPYYSYYYPVPAYYSGSYYPVEGVAAPSQVVAVAEPPPLPRFGIGVFAGGVSTDYNNQTDTSETDLGVLGRFRLTDGLILEGELGRTSTSVNGVDNVRVDRRLGGSLLYEFGAHNRLAPYVLAGLGVEQAQVDGDYSTTQDYGELGVGLRYAFSRNFHLTFDVRAGERSSVSSDNSDVVTGVAKTVTPPSSNSNDNKEDYTRARLAAILYF
ncbi:MAG: outer membrane beta-barrel protein [Kofleriaceae bacterium]